MLTVKAFFLSRQGLNRKGQRTSGKESRGGKGGHCVEGGRQCGQILLMPGPDCTETTRHDSNERRTGLGGPAPETGRENAAERHQPADTSSKENHQDEDVQVGNSGEDESVLPQEHKHE